jgi:hypothetical protein
MKTATGVLLDSTERAEVARAARWIGLHPEAEAATGRKQSRRENETVRQMFASLLSSVYDGTEPIFGERLDTVRTMLNETLINAQQQVSAQYWIARNCMPGEANVMADARAEALPDLFAALKVLDAARPFAQHVRDLVYDLAYGEDA